MILVNTFCIFFFRVCFDPFFLNGLAVSFVGRPYLFAVVIVHFLFLFYSCFLFCHLQKLHIYEICVVAKQSFSVYVSVRPCHTIEIQVHVIQKKAENDARTLLFFVWLFSPMYALHLLLPFSQTLPCGCSTLQTFTRRFFWCWATPVSISYHPFIRLPLFIFVCWLYITVGLPIAASLLHGRLLLCVVFTAVVTAAQIC